mgnify:CR=1 FL=1
MAWIQRVVTVAAVRRGLHLITGDVVGALPELGSFQVGLLNLFIQHTSASLTLNENADPDVRVDLESWLTAVAPESFDFQHTLEGADDMPAHVKASLLGNSLSVPIRSGRLALGTWQGIYLCEHRNVGSPRKLILTIQGERAP